MTHILVVVTTTSATSATLALVTPILGRAPAHPTCQRGKNDTKSRHVMYWPVFRPFLLFITNPHPTLVNNNIFFHLILMHLFKNSPVPNKKKDFFNLASLCIDKNDFPFHCKKLDLIFILCGSSSNTFWSSTLH